MTTRALSIVALTLLLAACDPLTRGERRAVHDWLVCEECTQEQLEAVVQLGDRGVWPLAQALRDAPDEGKDIIREQTRAMHARAVTVMPHVPEQQYVDNVVANYVATYQRRAAIGLREIATPAAHNALVTAVRDHTRYRPDVMREIGQAAGVQLSIVQGDNQSALVGTHVSINPKVQVGDRMHGGPIWGVQVLFLVDSGGGRVTTDSIQYTDLNGRTQVRWQLGLVPGTNVLRATAAGREVFFQATGN